MHVQWNSLTNSVKAINTTGNAIDGLKATARVYGLDGRELPEYAATGMVNLPATGNAEAFTLDFSSEPEGVHFIVLELRDKDGNLLSDNFYWRNGKKDLDYTAINSLPEAKVSVTAKRTDDGKATLYLKNEGNTVAFANRLRLLDAETGERILPIIMTENYVTLLPGAEREIAVDYADFAGRPVNVMIKQSRASGCHSLIIFHQHLSHC